MTFLRVTLNENDAILTFWLQVKKRPKRHVFSVQREMAASHRQPQPGVPSPSAPEGAPGGDGFRMAIAERNVRISIRVLGVFWG